MDLYPYNALSLEQRAEQLWSNGVFISLCRRRDPFVLYYLMEDYFVELEYDAAQVQILGLTAFRNGERYQRMVDAIRLDTTFDDRPA